MLNNTLKSKFGLRIFLFLMLSSVLLILILSSLVFFQLQIFAVNNAINANEDTLRQVTYNIEYINSVVRQIATSFYYSQTIQNIIYNPDPEATQIEFRNNYTEISNNIGQAFIHSIFIYNYLHDTLYTTGYGIFSSNDLLDTIYYQIFNSIPKLQPLPVTLQMPNSFDDQVLSYFLYEGEESEAVSSSAVIMNIEIGWFYKQIERFSVGSRRGGIKIFLLYNDRVIADNGEKGFASVLQNTTALFDVPSIDTSELNSSIRRIDGRKYLVTVLPIRRSDLAVVQLQEYKEVLRDIAWVRVQIIAVCIITLFAAAVASFFISRVIYKPMSEVMSRIENTRAHDNPGRIDDVKLIDELYEDYRKQVQNNEERRRKLQFKQLLLNSEQFCKENNLMQDLKQAGIPFINDEYLIMVLFRIDDFSKNVPDNTGDYILALKHRLSRMLSYQILKGGRGTTVDMENDSILLIMLDESVTGYERWDILRREIKKAQKEIDSVLKLSISAFYSMRSVKLNQSTDHYNRLLDVSRYRYLYGRCCILSDREVQHHIDVKRFNYPADMEDKLVFGIKSGNWKQVRDAFNLFISVVSVNRYQDIFLSIVYISSALARSVEEKISVLRLSSRISCSQIVNNFLNADYISDLPDLLNQVIADVEKYHRDDLSGRDNLLVDAVKDVIHERFRDPLFGQQVIADIFKFSYGYIGSLFKNVAKISIRQYIDDYRIDQAAELIRETKLSILEILNDVGFLNESNFYRHFKKKFGITPFRYRTITKLHER